MLRWDTSAFPHPLAFPHLRTMSAPSALFRTHRDDPGSALSGAAVSCAEAAKSELNALLDSASWPFTLRVESP